MVPSLVRFSITLHTSVTYDDSWLSIPSLKNSGIKKTCYRKNERSCCDALQSGGHAFLSGGRMPIAICETGH